MLYENREKFERLSIKIGLFFSKLPLSPNQWTLLSIFPAAIAAFLLSREEFILSAFFFAFAAFLDIVDGSVARVLGRATKFGAYLDTITDRYVEFIILLGLFFAKLPRFYLSSEAWLMLYFFGSMMTTYAKSAAKEKGLVETELKGGILERAERLILLFAGIILAALNPLYLVYVVATLALLANISAMQRIIKAKKLSNE